MVWSSVLSKPRKCHDTMQGELLMHAKWISSGIDLPSLVPSWEINLLFLVKVG